MDLPRLAPQVEKEETRTVITDTGSKEVIHTAIDIQVHLRLPMLPPRSRISLLSRALAPARSLLQPCRCLPSTPSLTETARWMPQSSLLASKSTRRSWNVWEFPYGAACERLSRTRVERTSGVSEAPHDTRACER